MSDDERVRVVKHRGKWALRYKCGDQWKRESTGLDATDENRAEAEREKDDIERQLDAPESQRLDDIMQAYIKAKEKKGRDAQRDKDHRNALKPVFGGLFPDDITAETCERFIRRRRDDGKKDGTIIRDLKVLRAAVNKFAPGSKAVFEYPDSTEPRDKHLTRGEFDRLLRAAKDTYHFSVFLHVAIATAARKGAILDLTWHQVRWSGEGSIWFGHKANGKRRATVPMSPTLRAVLQEAKKHKHPDCNHVIQYNGKPVKNVRTAFEASCRRAKLRGYTIHDIRHTAAVWMAGDGVAMSKISQYLGHSNTEVTERVYARYQPEHLRDAANALDVVQMYHRAPSISVVDDD